MFKTILSSKRYWTSVLYLGLGLVLVYSIIEHIREFGGLEWDSFVNERVKNGLWIRYFVSRIIGGLLYGMIMGYYFELRKRKLNR